MLRTILFTDIEGSTERWEKHPVEMQVALATHDRILRDTFSTHGADWWKGTGDGFAASFESASAALEAALAIQHELAGTTWQGIDGIRIRVGVHMGEVVARDDDRFGPTMNRAARIMSSAHGGQVIASAGVIDAAGPTELVITDLGRHRLKDLLDPTQLLQVDLPGSSSTFPPLRSLPAQTNLPIDRSSFIGRDEEVAATAALARAQRLVTLVGPGGVGKTRLAIHAAAEVADAHPHGVWFIPLGAVTDHTVIADEIARILGILPEDGASPLAALREHARTRKLLLVIDNCEHLIGSVASLVEELLAVGPDLSIIATSREPLSVREERVLRVEPLATGPREAAVQLFIDRAGETGADLDPDDPAIPRICTRLDGLALAIELAAAKTRSLRLADLEQRLENRFSVLKRSRGGLDHHQTLAATIAWSYDLASDAERIVLNRLSVFPGLFSMGWASRVAGYGHLDDLEVFEALERLHDRSLVAAVATDDAERYYLLESIKEYANSRRIEAEDGDAVRNLVHVVGDLATQRHLPGSEDESEWLAAMHRNAPSLREALSATHEIGDAPALAAIVVGAARYWIAAGFADEGARWAEVAMSLGRPTPTLRETLGDLYLSANRDSDADAVYEELLALPAAEDDVIRARLIRKLTSRSTMVTTQLRNRSGAARLTEALALLGVPSADWPDERLHEWINVQLDMAGLGYFGFDADRQRDAIESVRPWLPRATPRQHTEFGIVERGLLYQETRYRPPAGLPVRTVEFGGVGPANQEAYSSALFRTAFYELLMDEVEAAHRHLAESADMAERLGSDLRLARVFAYYSLASRRLRRTDECRQLSGRAMEHAIRAEHHSYMAVAGANQGWCDLRAGDPSEARRQLEDAATRFAERARRYPFRWIALLPLLEVHSLASDWSAAVAVAGELLDPHLQRLPDDLESALRDVVEATSADPSNAIEMALSAARRHRLS